MVTDSGDTSLSSDTIGVPVCTVDCQLGNAIVGLQQQSGRRQLPDPWQ